MNIVRKGTTQVVQQNKHENEMEYLTFPSITATGIVGHAFSTRIGGASKGYFGEANYSFTRGDVREDVEENYRRMAQILGYGRSLEHFVTTFQTHTSNVRVITADDMGKGVIKERDYVDVDGMITNIPGIILTTFHADCPPIYFVDPVKRAIGLSHSGWKGTVSRIGRSTVEAMTREYGSKPSDIICAVGPSICVDCYEVSGDVADKFIDEFGIKDVPEYIPDGDSAGHIVYRKSGGKYQLNLWEAIRHTLIEAGVKPENIEITDICTHCNPDYLFSHRTAGEKRGNLAAFLVLN
ncbi:peptidoglycan editing factor PgeF [Butyrivibrio fibrisolvens]|uniref:peptidoglycan editing factor PgeF n=1 Tax=Butyrivibrio fibrisolvens TaxID=831 RepID=UPI000481CDBA|nr:peptidoglycan editing factor PgeF [Butyrivibrio fibrisolvens]